MCKRLLPIYDKPMICYPLLVLMLAGIQDVLFISTPEDIDRFKKLFGSGQQLGMRFDYVIQPSPDGLAQAFILGESFIGQDDVCLVLGDNIFYGDGFIELLRNSVNIVKNNHEAVVFGYKVSEPEHYGVVEFDKDNRVISIEEKPTHAKSRYAVVGLYFYPNNVITKAKDVNPSARGELEITSINSAYLLDSKLKVELFGRGFAWLDKQTTDLKSCKTA